MKKKSILIIIIIFISIICFFSIRNIRNKEKSIKDSNVIDIDCKEEKCKKQSNISSNKNSNIESNSSQNNTSNSNNTETSNNTSNSSSNVTSNIIIASNSNKNNSSSNTNSNKSSDSGKGKNVKGATEENNSSNENDKSNNVEDEDGDLVFKDTDEIWVQERQINIFDVDEIAPGAHGSYEFVVNNNTKENVKYKINFNEINKYKANVMYKLMRNNEYIAGDKNNWVYYDKLNINGKVVNKGKQDVYKIEWRWIDAENDTEVGIAAIDNDVTYTLKLEVEYGLTDEVDKKGVKGAGESNPKTSDDILKYISIAFFSLLALIILIKNKIKEEYND